MHIDVPSTRTPTTFKGVLLLKNKYHIIDDVAYIEIHSEKHGYFETLVSIEDVERLSEMNCSVYIANHRNDFYAHIYLGDEKRYSPLHRYLLDEPKHLVVDHIDHNTLNNTKSNLRAVTQVENTQNVGMVRSHNKSGYRGVFYRKREKKYQAYAYLNGKKHELGLYDSAEEAGQVSANFRALYQTASPDHREIKNPILPQIKHSPGRENKSAGIKGITKTRSGKWLAQINYKHKLHRSPVCETLEEAISALEDIKQKIGYKEKTHIV